MKTIFNFKSGYLFLFIFITLECISSNHLKGAQSSVPLTDVQKKLIKLQQGCLAATVGLIEAKRGDGSGVIVSKDGMILTAGHVVSGLGQEVDVFLSDGSRAKAVVVLQNKNSDTAICQIVSPSPANGWPYRPLRLDDTLSLGDWCFTIAHGGGIRGNRPAPLKIGRLLRVEQKSAQTLLTTDCSAVSGDSGGALFDLEGRVIAVNSNVSPVQILQNSHVSTLTFKDQWEDFLTHKRALPTAKHATGYLLDTQHAQGITSNVINPKLKVRVKSMLRASFKDMPEKGVELVSNDASFIDGKVKIHLTQFTYHQLLKGGVKPEKYGFKKPKLDTEAARKDAWVRVHFGIVKPEIHNYIVNKMSKNDEWVLSVDFADEDKKFLTDLGFNHLEKAIEVAMSNKYSHCGTEARIAVKKFLKWTAEGLTLTPDLVERDYLAQIGVVSDNAAFISQKQMVPIFRARLKRKLGKEFAEEALVILAGGVTSYDPKTGAVKSSYSEEAINRLRALGVPHGLDAPKPLEEVASELSDSADNIIAQLPELGQPIRLFQAGDPVGLLTPISEDGEALTKFSLLNHIYLLSAEVNGKLVKVEFLGKDDVTDLALLKVETKFDKSMVMDWQEAELPVGALLACATNDGFTIAANSVPYRKIAERPMDVFGTSKKDGKNVDSFAQFISAQSGGLSHRRFDFPTSISHDAKMKPEDCGGPIYTLDGKLAGVNIARYGRTTNYALPKTAIDEAIVRLREDSSLEIVKLPSNKKKTHVFYLLGGEVMSGWESPTAADSEPVEGVYFATRGSFVEWRQAAHPVHTKRGKPLFGPAIAFAKAYRKANPDVTVCLIPLASSSSNAYSYHTKSLTGNRGELDVRIRFSAEFGVPKGVIFQMGRYDFFSDKTAAGFSKKIQELISHIREEANDPELAILLGELPPGMEKHPAIDQTFLEMIQDGVIDLPKKVSNLKLVSTDNLTSPVEDSRRLDRKSTIELGKRYAEAFLDGKE